MIPTNTREEERKLFTDTLNKLVAAIAPEKIICDGNRIDDHESWSSFLPVGNTRYSTYYDLLIIIKDRRHREVNIYEILDSDVKPPIHITAVVHDIGSVNEGIEKGDQFFVTMYHKGMIVYDNYKTPLAVPDAEIDEHRRALFAEDAWNRYMTLAKKYRTLAEMCLERPTKDLNDMSALMLHQSANVASHAIVRYYTGYYAGSYDLEWVLSLMKNFTSEAEYIFSNATDEETQHFAALCNIYSDMRHGKSYSIPLWRIEVLLRKIWDLINAVEKLHDEKKNPVKLPALPDPD
jgi:hypothetical protein